MVLMICGIDEAGRGPVIGPMVICGILIGKKDVERLRQLGVKDSKLLSPSRREMLDRLIKEVAQRYDFVRISPEEIDRERERRSLNDFEAEKFGYLISRLKPSEVYIDSVDPNPRKFMDRIFQYTEHRPKRIVVENFADRKYIPVAAASILAKVERDRLVDELRRRFGDFGSGYPSDPRTISFLREWKKVHGEFPNFVRKSWETLKNI
jgi:ribonuclease HII